MVDLCTPTFSGSDLATASVLLLCTQVLDEGMNTHSLACSLFLIDVIVFGVILIRLILIIRLQYNTGTYFHNMYMTGIISF